MARLFKPTIVRYTNSQGRRCKKGDPGAIKKRTKSKTWRGQFRDSDGILRSVKLCTNKPAAAQMLAELVRRSEREQAGLVDPFEQHRKRFLTEHLEGFHRYLEAKGNSTGYVNETTGKILAIVDGCGFKRIGDISASRVMEWLADCRKADMGIATSNHYLTAIKGFTGWLVKDRRTGDNPLAHLSRLNASTDVRRERRVLPPAEFGRLIDAATHGVTVCGLSGPDRAMLYVTAAYTGLRAAELASLVEVSFDFDASPLTVTIEAGYSKHRRKDVLPLHPDLARRLQKWLPKRLQAGVDENPVLPLTLKGRVRRKAVAGKVG